ncbi:UDP-glucuronic acid decarboxylase 1 [Anaerolineaceae bacterium]|nr:UDP-glucuronic acid decarboxylase 1 [Anaerolineaceae bacterium]
MTRYLVTGGAGFIGSNIVEELVRRGATVRVADNFSTGRIENLSGLVDRVELLTGDLAELDFARHAMRDVDFVMHLPQFRACRDRLLIRLRTTAPAWLPRLTCWWLRAMPA